MESRRNQDRLSKLSDMVLVLIISNLPFKEAVKTSILAKRWKNLHRENTNVVFNESEFVKSSDDGDTKMAARVSFVRFMLDWISKFSGEGIETFKLCFSKPVGFETEITSLMQFAVSKKVKNLFLDFSDPSWVTSNQAKEEEGNVFQIPECVYKQTNLESLKIFACRFVPSKLARAGSLKCLCFGWNNLGNIMDLLPNSPLIETLTIKNCWNVGLEAITSDKKRLRELIIENSDFSTPYSTLDVPNIQIFKYTGKVHYFQFMEVNRSMEEAYLDFEAETEDNDATGILLAGLLYDLLSAKKLTVCPFLLQLIQDSDDPVQLQAPMETKHLIIKTSLQPNEFVGIRLMINSCPELETLTFEMVAPRNVSTTAIDFNPETYWAYEISHRCLKKTLKVVEVKNFNGNRNELVVLKYLVRWSLVLEKVDLYMPSGVNENLRSWICSLVKTMGKAFVAASDRLWFYLHTG